MATERLIVASKNPVKINASLSAFKEVFLSTSFLVDGISVSSGVSAQPMSDEETFQGAINRAVKARETYPIANFWVGLEGGVEEIGGETRSVVWAVVLSKDQIGKAKTASFILPPKMAEMIKGGMEMGDADDMIFGTVNSKQKLGAIGLLTNGVIDRTKLYKDGVILALIPFLNPELYPV